MAKRLTKKQKGFAIDYIETGNGTQSALKNYDTTDYKTAGVIAVENLAKPSVREYLDSKAEKVAEVIFTLATTAINETVQLNASKDILDRTGYKPVEKTANVDIQIKGDIKDFEKMDAVRLEYEEKLRASLITK